MRKAWVARVMPDGRFRAGEPSSNSASTAFRFCAIERVAVISMWMRKVKSVICESGHAQVDRLVDQSVVSCQLRSAMTGRDGCAPKSQIVGLIELSGVVQNFSSFDDGCGASQRPTCLNWQSV